MGLDLLRSRAEPDLHGTGNPGPWNPDLRPGDNKWTAGIFARDPDTGAARWFYQWSPHDLHDYDGINEQVLLDMSWNGQPRKVLVRPERNGYVYMLDRTTGEVLSAEPFGAVNSTKGVDLKTGRPIPNPDKEPSTGKVVRNICPTASGRQGLATLGVLAADRPALHPAQQSLHGRRRRRGELHRRHALCRHERADDPGPGGHRGAFTAWDIAKAAPAWKLDEEFPVWSGAVATAGDVVFYGTMEGWFKAISARTGELLWQFKTASGIIGQPITYRGPDGRQYVAILSGVGGWAGAVVSGDLDPRDGTAALGFANAMKDLKDVTTPGGTLYVFRLP